MWIAFIAGGGSSWCQMGRGFRPSSVTHILVEGQAPCQRQNPAVMFPSSPNSAMAGKLTLTASAASVKTGMFRRSLPFAADGPPGALQVR
ncbi:MAG: hypothetical protein C0478_05250 [Planctomyces sp.]|nr:hypothetical protein [Planctomyces sp.]